MPAYYNVCPPPVDLGTGALNESPDHERPMDTGPRRVRLAIVAGASARGDGFDRNVRPLVQKYCLRCHGDQKPKGDINLVQFADEESLRGDPELWGKVVDALVERSMPPPGDKAGPNEEDRQRAAASIQAVLDAIEGVPDPGPSLIQRLTRLQYNNTVRDLLGVDARPADAFPADGGGGGGFDNNASTLFVPPILLEKYLAAAGDVLAEAAPARYLVARPGPDISKKEAARRCIATFARRAFRRPVGDDEVERLMRLFRHADARGDGFEDAVRLALQGRAGLAEASSTWWSATGPTPMAPTASPTTSWPAGCRTSSGLRCPTKSFRTWPTPGGCTNPGCSRARSGGCSPTRSPGRWPRTSPASGSASATSPSSRIPTGGSSPSSRPSCAPQWPRRPSPSATRCSARIGRSSTCSIPITRYLNEPLAKHYGIEGVTGPEFRRVALKDRNRGGVLGMAAVLTLTSYPRRTSPVLRGKWVLEELLGTPPPPPPPWSRRCRPTTGAVTA